MRPQRCYINAGQNHKSRNIKQDNKAQRILDHLLNQG